MAVVRAIGCLRYQQTNDVQWRASKHPVKPMSAFIVEGDTTSHGGKVFGCASISIINGKRIARLGDMVSCPKCGGAYPIVTSKNPGMDMNGRPPAFEGDKTACGATLVSSQSLASANVPTGVGSVAGREASVSHEAPDRSDGRYRGRFQVLDETTGEPIPNHPYTLHTADGRTLSGKTDLNGYTEWHEADAPASLQFSSASTQAAGWNGNA